MFPYPAHMQANPEVDALVEAWIDHLIQAGGQTVIMPTDDNAFDAIELPATVTPTKKPPNKRQRQVSSTADFSTDLDIDPTPRPSCRHQGHYALSETTELSGTAGTDVSASTSVSASASRASQQSGRSSPRKKEAALRRARDWPIARVQLAKLRTIPPVLERLAVGLQTIADGAQPLIPDLFRPSMEADTGFLNQLRPAWFYPARGPEHDPMRLFASHSYIQRIHRNSLQCRDIMDHEPAWNGLVHARILEEALEGCDSVCFRDLTVCRTKKKYHDGDPALRENKVDYGIFLQPRSEGFTASADRSADNNGLAELLADLAGEDVDITHCTLSDLAPTPLAVSIETKTPQANTVEGSVQLASWVRAHFRQLAKVVERRGHDPASHPLPILPIIFVQGNIWRVDFAHRCDAKTMIYEGIVVGDTHTLYGCYQACAAVRLLATWVQADFQAWWLRAARPESLSI